MGLKPLPVSRGAADGTPGRAREMTQGSQQCQGQLLTGRVTADAGRPG